MFSNIEIKYTLSIYFIVMFKIKENYGFFFGICLATGFAIKRPQFDVKKCIPTDIEVF